MRRGLLLSTRKMRQKKVKKEKSLEREQKIKRFGEFSNCNTNGQSDTDITLRSAQGNTTTVESVKQANTKDGDLTTGGNCISYEDRSWDSKNECFTSQPVLRHADPGFRDAMFNSMSSFNIKGVAETLRAQRQFDHVAVYCEGVYSGSG